MNQDKKYFANRIVDPLFTSGLIAFLLLTSIAPLFGQTRVSGANGSPPKKASERGTKAKTQKPAKVKTGAENSSVYPEGERKGEKIIVPVGGQKTVEELMAEQSLREGQKTNRELLKEKGVRMVPHGPDRSGLPQNLDAPNVSKYPYSDIDDREFPNYSPFAPQTIGLNFDTVTGPTETGAFPPDTMGAVGPTQFFVFLNGRLRTFNKTTGTADGVINVNSDVFFASVMTPPTASNFTTDPNIRYDRLSGRWFLNMIDVPGGAGAIANRIMIAVSDGPNITGATVWTYYFFSSPAGLFTDYQSFGVDASALYIGANMFTLAGAFSRTDGWVIPKAPAVAGTALTIWAFPGLVATSTGSGPFSPRGVDNVDPANTGPTALGYFIGVDNALFSTLMIRRVTNPGNTVSSPTMSANIPLTVPTTNFSNPVTHLGNTGGNNGRLDALDDRLYAAVLRGGRLWTAHNIRVSAAGVANTGVEARNASRWYEIQDLNATPSLVQSGTVFDTAATLATARQYWIPSITVNGQGHAAIGASTAGTNFRIDAMTTGRLVGDTLGTLRNSPGSIAGYTTSTFAYNPPGDPGGASGRRWGDYSFTSLDPLDDMTIWTIQQYNNGTNTYGTRVAQLLAPPPAGIADGPNSGVYNVPANTMSFNLTITGTSVSGSGWYDPGPNLGGGAVNFNHISASVSGTNVTVNSVTYNSPTSLTLNLNTMGATVSEPNLSPNTLRDLTITNPDGQQVTRNAIINVLTPTAAGATITGKAVKPDGRPLIGTTMRLTGTFGPETLTSVTRTDGSYFFQDVPTGSDVIVTPERHGYTFSPTTRFVNLSEDIDEVDFVGTPGAVQARAAINDFDGDGISDYAVYRPSQKVWFILESSTNTTRVERWGLESDVPAAGDYDGDGVTDVAMWRPSDGTWYIIQSADGVQATLRFGTNGDIPVYGYYDGDQLADIAVFRPSTATWWILESSTGNTRVLKWGLPTDRPVPADYDGDGVSDIAVFRPAEGIWYVLKSSDDSHLFYRFGLDEDMPAPGDYDGDGKADFAVFRPDNGVWYRTDSSNSAISSVLFGLKDDLVVTGDFDGDSRADISLFRESDSKWHSRPSLLGGTSEIKWGMKGDLPVRPPFMR